MLARIHEFAILLVYCAVGKGTLLQRPSVGCSFCCSRTLRYHSIDYTRSVKSVACGSMGTLRCEILFPAERIPKVARNVKCGGHEWQTYHLHSGKTALRKKRSSHVKFHNSHVLISKKVFTVILDKNCHQPLLWSLFVLRNNVDYKI